MSNIKIFENLEFGSIRTVEQNGEPWFVGKDVATALRYSNPRKAIADHVDKEDKGVTNRYTPGGNQNMTIINESGLYSLILSSKLPTAKEVQTLGNQRCFAGYPQARSLCHSTDVGAHDFRP